MAELRSREEFDTLFQSIRKLHETIRRVVIDACEHSAIELLASVAQEEGATTYAVDRISEDVLVD